jgi:hypothetical protein
MATLSNSPPTRPQTSHIIVITVAEAICSAFGSIRQGELPLSADHDNFVSRRMATVAGAIHADKVQRRKKYKVTPTQQAQPAIKAPPTCGIAIAAEKFVSWTKRGQGR